MTHPLDGARFKVVRAQEHLDAFESEFIAFENTKPYTFESEVYGEHWWLKPRITAHPPGRLSLIVGDVVTNLKASLDYVIWETASKYFSDPIDISKQLDRAILNFPVLLHDPSRRNGYIDHLRRLERRGLPTAAIEIIQSVQADASGDESLRHLSDLVNTDKHRTPILALSFVDRVQVHINSYAGRAWLIRSDDYAFIKGGVTLKAPPDLLAGIRAGTVEVNLQMSIEITCGNPPMPMHPLRHTLANILKCAADVIARFDPFFT